MHSRVRAPDSPPRPRQAAPVSGSSSTLAAVFIGRKEIVGAVMRALAEPTGRDGGDPQTPGPAGLGVVLHGPRRIGKTSILKHLVLAIPERTRHQPVYFDPQDRAAQPLDEVLGDLARTIAETLELPEPTPRGDVGAWLSGTWLPSVLRELTPGTSLVLLIDELDVHAHPGEQSAARAFHQYLRRLVDALAPRLRIVVALGRNAADHEGAAGAIFEGLASCRVSLFSREDAETLIRAPGPPAWSDEAVEAAWALTHGHPLLLQALAANVRAMGAADSTATPGDVAAAAEATSSRHRNAFEWIWKGLPPAARAIAAAIAPAGTDGTSEEKLHAVLREQGVIALVPSIREAREKLAAWDVIESPSPGKYRFRVEMLRRLVARYKPPTYIQQDLDLVDPAAEELCRAGEALQRAGNLGAAKARYAEAIAKNPNHGRASDLLADVLIARKEWAAANEVLDRIHEVRPASARARREKVLRAIAEDAKAPAAPKVETPAPTKAIEAEKQALVRAIEAEKQARAKAEARVTALTGERDRLLERLRAEHQPSIVVGADPTALTKSLEAEKQARAKAEVRIGLLTAERDRWRTKAEAQEAEHGRIEQALQTMTLERDQMAAELDARDRPSTATRAPLPSVPMFIETPITLPEPAASPRPPSIAPKPLSIAPPPSLAPPPTDPAVVLAEPKPRTPRSAWNRLAAPAFAVTGAALIAGAAAMQTKGIELDATAITIVDRGDSRRVAATKVIRIGKRMPAGGLTWTSADPRVAEVDAQGTITPKGSGKTRIEARSGAMASTVDVMVSLPARIEVATPALTLTPSAKEAELKARVLDGLGAAWANRADIQWTSRAPNVASVGSGKVHREGPGDTVIEARFGDLVGSVAVRCVDDRFAATMGCDAGDAVACLALGRMALDGEPREALSWYAKACTGGSMKGCVEAGAMYEDGKAGKPDAASAVAMYQKACDGKEPSGCSRLGAMYETGTGVIPNIGKARELHRAACESGDAYGCWHLGAIYELGNGVARDTPIAADFYKKACDGGQWAACGSLANMYWNGSGKVTKDVAAGLALYEKACDGKHEAACTVLALNYKSGDGVEISRAKSYAFFWKACEAGSRAACVIAPRPPD